MARGQTAHIPHISTAAECSLAQFAASVFTSFFPTEITALQNLVFISSDDLGDHCHVRAQMDCFSMGPSPLWVSGEKSSRNCLALSDTASPRHWEVGWGRRGWENRSQGDTLFLSDTFWGTPLWFLQSELGPTLSMRAMTLVPSLVTGSVTRCSHLFVDLWTSGKHSHHCHHRDSHAGGAAEFKWN